ncbi:MAG TPA: sugar transferase [Candidatus Sulfotelmatobacter sp.]
MGSPFFNSEQPDPAAVDWARLIPGQTPGLGRPNLGRPSLGKPGLREAEFRRNGKKPVQSVRPGTPGRKPGSQAQIVAQTAAAYTTESSLTYLLPHPLQGQMAWKWIRATAADFALVALNWLLIGALLVPLRALFPHVNLFHYAAGAPAWLLGLAFLHAVLITLVAYAEGLHAEETGLRGEVRILGKSVLWATTVLCVTYGLQGATRGTSALFCAAGMLHFVALWTWRGQRARLERHLPASAETRNVLVVGAGGVGRRIASYIEQHPEEGRTVCGFLDDERPIGNDVIGRVRELARLARMGFVDEVILASPHNRELTRQVLHESRRLRLDLKIVPELFGCKTGGGTERLGDLLLISLHNEQLPAAGLVLKRLVDVIGAGLAFVVLTPLLAAIAGLIKLDSRGPVLYCAPRAGRKGQRFRCYKFRTMVSNADALKEPLRRNNQRSGPFFKIADDPRITRLGRFLRHYSIDELPQLWNVLKGEMSLVGPRPHPLDDVAGYEIEHLARLDVTPGITGLWQVTARRDPSFQRGMDLDREYIHTWSLGSDMRILLKTVRVVLCGSGD